MYKTHYTETIFQEKTMKTDENYAETIIAMSEII